MSIVKVTQIRPCTECQRRKQKCNREWPCDHCSKRRIPHLCQFDEHTSSSHQGGVLLTRRPSEPECAAAEIDESALDAWGYAPPLELSGTTQTRSQAADHCPLIGIQAQEEFDRASDLLDDQVLVDLLIRDFLKHGNLQSASIDAPVFLQEYSRWRKGSADMASNHLPTVVLVLRMCGLSATAPSVQLRSSLAGLGLALPLGETYYYAAEKLNVFARRHGAILKQLQQLILTATWLKLNAQLADAWHTIAAGIHLVEEQGMREKMSNSPNMYVVAMVDRLWSTLRVWDWQSVNWLGRPRLIRTTDRGFYPQAFLSFANAPESRHISLQATLIDRLDQAQSMHGETSHALALAVHGIAHDWMHDLPHDLQLSGVDSTQTDDVVTFQRLLLNLIGYMTAFTIHKQWLTRPVVFEPDSLDIQLREEACICSISLLRVARRFCAHISPFGVKYHTALFAIFDTTSVLCSAILHDSDGGLPIREQVLSAIGQSLQILQQASSSSRSAAVSTRFLKDRLQLMSPTDHATISNAADWRGEHALWQGEPVMPDASSEIGVETMDWADLQNVALDAVDQAWDWQSLAFDEPSLPQINP